MKKVLILTVAVFFSIGLLAQNADTIKIKLGSKKILIIEKSGDDSEVIVDSLEEDYDYDIDEFINKKDDNEGDEEEDDESDFDAHWSGLEFGINNYLNANNELVNQDEAYASSLSKSWGFNLNLLEFDFPVIKENLGFVTGLGFEWNNYNFENNSVSLQVDENALTEFYVEEIEFQKNKLHTSYLTIPAMIEFQAPIGKRQKKIYMAAGVIGGIKINSRTCYEYDIDGVEHERKEKNDYNLNSIRYAISARIGYDKLQLFANYNVTPLFETDKGPELYPFTVGIHILNF